MASIESGWRAANQKIQKSIHLSITFSFKFYFFSPFFFFLVQIKIGKVRLDQLIVDAVLYLRL